MHHSSRVAPFFLLLATYFSNRTLLSYIGFFLCTVAASLRAKIEQLAKSFSAFAFCIAGIGPRGSRLWQFYIKQTGSLERISLVWLKYCYWHIHPNILDCAYKASRLLL